jgi:hypothetical protein
VLTRHDTMSFDAVSFDQISPATELTCQVTALGLLASCFVPTVPRSLAPCIGSIPAIVSPRGLYVKFLPKKDQKAKILRREEGGGLAGASAGVRDPMVRHLGETRPYNGAAGVSSTLGNGRGASSCEVTGDLSVGDGGVILQKNLSHRLAKRTRCTCPYTINFYLFYHQFIQNSL